ncbi:MAG TPA: hypothetical protein VF230_01905 [Acidimicrobiales bacterium]
MGNLRRLVMALIVAVSMAACGSGGGEEEPPKDVSIGGDVTLPPSKGGTTTPPTPGGGAPATTAAKGSSAATTAKPAADGATTTTSRSGSSQTVQTTPSRNNAFPAMALQGYSTSILLKFGVESGLEPSAEAIEHVRSTFEGIARKPVRVERVTLTASPSTRRWKGDDAAAVARDRLGENDGGNTAMLRILWVHGRHDASEGTLGFASNDLIVIFPQRIRHYSTPVLSAARLEKTVLLHEAGHSFGLVDLYLNTGRQDPEHPAHSSNRESVMYYAAETSAIATVFDGPPPTTFDAEDLADFEAIRKGAQRGARR